MADIQKGPFDRVANGYDPQQVATFAAEALTWKRDLAACRGELRAALASLDRYESVMGAVEDIEGEAAQITEDAERRATEIIRQAEDEAAKILETAAQSTEVQPAQQPAPETRDDRSTGMWLAPEPEDDQPDPIEEIFEEFETDDFDPEAEREQRIAAAANLWKRRGVLTPPE